MMNLGLSRPNSFLTTLTLTVLTFPNICPAEQPPATFTRPSNSNVNVDSRLMSALLTPMAHLVPAPYANEIVLENPLGIEPKVSLTPATKPIKEIPLIAESMANSSYESYRPPLPAETLNTALLESPLTFVEPAMNTRTLALTIR